MTADTRSQAQFDDLRQTGRTNGSAAALDLLSTIQPPPWGRERYILLPEHIIAPAKAVVKRTVPTDGAPLVMWSTEAEHDEADSDDHLWWLGITWIRIGLCERLLDHATDWLRHRKVGDEVTLNLQAVRLIVSDAALEHGEAEALLNAEKGLPSVRALTIANMLLDDSVCLSLRLLGAHGYIDGAPARLAYSTEILGHIEGYGYGT